eukprot:6971752-Lingulodinium_polyedra.AAC.1
MSGPEAVTGCCARILQTLPSAERVLTPEASLQLMSQLAAHASWKIAPHSAQMLLEWARGLVTKLCEEEPLTVADAKVHANAGEVLAAVPYFVRDGSGDASCHGAEA